MECQSEVRSLTPTSLNVDIVDSARTISALHLRCHCGATKGLSCYTHPKAFGRPGMHCVSETCTPDTDRQTSRRRILDGERTRRRPNAVHPPAQVVFPLDRRLPVPLTLINHRQIYFEDHASSKRGPGPRVQAFRWKFPDSTAGGAGAACLECIDFVGFLLFSPDDLSCTLRAEH